MWRVSGITTEWGASHGSPWLHPSTPLIGFSKLHHRDKVPMATKHESVSMRGQGLAESTLQTSQSKSGG